MLKILFSLKISKQPSQKKRLSFNMFIRIEISLPSQVLHRTVSQLLSSPTVGRRCTYCFCNAPNSVHCFCNASNSAGPTFQHWWHDMSMIRNFWAGKNNKGGLKTLKQPHNGAKFLFKQTTRLGGGERGCYIYLFNRFSFAIFNRFNLPFLNSFHLLSLSIFEQVYICPLLVFVEHFEWIFP